MPADPQAPARAPVRVRLPAHLVRLFPDGETLVEVAAGDVRQLMDALDARWPGMRSRLCDERPAIRRHINVFVDGRRARLDTPLAPGANVFILTAISGG
ncbi:MoaD/ThiS family protein [Xanthobacter versatilis]|uniref:MoaD/ThiS family protein n=1 Tax=Xanthobacter autotrophicus (strain ATCC BAA-1158 / Py2) TaxID=78245 RepID=UPI00372CCA5C